MENKKKFAHSCPSCRTQEKIVIKCKVARCRKYCCNLCSIDGVCMDCYVLEDTISELAQYYDDKQKDEIIDNPREGVVTHT